VWGAASVYQYFGDIGGTADKNNLMGLKDISFGANRPGISIGGIYRYDERWYFQVSNSFGFFTQTDKGSRNETRNYAFTTIANETSIQGMYFILKENNRNYSFSIINRRGGENQPLSIYAFAGLASVYYSVTPKESLDGSPRFVGDKHLSVAFPIGLGAKFSFTPEFSVGLDLGGRYTLTDYLDGFSSVYSKHKDLYYILNVKAIYRLPKAKPRPNIY